MKRNDWKYGDNLVSLPMIELVNKLKYKKIWIM